MNPAPLSPEELRRAYDRSGLKARGITFDQALENTATHRALEASANAARILPDRRTRKRDQEAQRHGQTRLFD